MKHATFTPDEIRKMRKLRLQDVNFKAIAIRFDTCISTIQRLLQSSRDLPSTAPKK